MSPLPWIHVFLDTPAADVNDAVSFWTSVTGWPSSDRRGEHGQFLTLLPPTGSAYVKIQEVDQQAGLHLDLDSTDRAASVERARRIGATSAWTYHAVEVMRSPGGFTFCHTLLVGAPSMVRDGSTILDQVCLDIPSGAWDVEIAFWQELTGRELERGRRPEFAFLGRDGHPRILLQRLDEPDGPVRAHPDLATADRAVDTAAHVALGAVVVAEHARWTVLTAPGGQVYCLTDRDPATGRVQ